MLKSLSIIKTLYTLALTEGEGMGTAYEYFAKRLVLDRWLAGGRRRRRCWWPDLTLTVTAVADVVTLEELDFFYDLVLCCEVIPRFPPENYPRYLERLRGLGQRVALFAPNGDNPAHPSRTGLFGLRLDQLAALVTPTSSTPSCLTTETFL